MFIRRTQTRSTQTGESYFTHRLVRTYRVGGKVRQETLLNLGRHFDIAQTHWPLLCTRIEELMRGQESLLATELPVAVEREAQHLASRLLARAGEFPSSEAKPPEGSGEFQSVDVDSLQLVRPRSVGVEHLALWAMEELKLLDLFESLGLTGPQRAAVAGLIVGRMAAPGSERATHRWLVETSALGELLDVDYERMSLMQLYRASDLLMGHRQAIEGRLFNHIAQLFGLSCTVTLYDLTNTYFEGEAGANLQAQRGHSKEKRSDCPLVTVGLVLDGSGFVRQSQTFAGNVSEAATLQQMLEALEAPRGALVVMDRGLATEANLAWLREAGYRYLVVSRERTRTFDGSCVVSIENASGQSIQLKKVRSDQGREVRLYCRSEQRMKKEEAIVRRFCERFETELKKLADGLSKPRTTKRIDKLWERIGRLKAKSHGVGQYYHIEMVPDDSGEKAKAITWQRQPIDGSMLTHPGVYCLRSNILDWDEERMWRTYIMLTDLEAVFRSLKSELGLRPIYHHTEARTDGHLFITVLAYQLVQFIRRRLADKDIHDSWQQLRTTLNNQRRVTAVFRRADGRTLHVRKSTQAESVQRAIYQALDINSLPGGVQKAIV